MVKPLKISKGGPTSRFEVRGPTSIFVPFDFFELISRLSKSELQRTTPIKKQIAKADLKDFILQLKLEISENLSKTFWELFDNLIRPYQNLLRAYQELIENWWKAYRELIKNVVTNAYKI